MFDHFDDYDKRVESNKNNQKTTLLYRMSYTVCFFVRVSAHAYDFPDVGEALLHH